MKNDLTAGRQVIFHFVRQLADTFHTFTMTIAQALKFAAAKLNSAKIYLPSLEAEILLSHILKKPREFLLAHGEKNLTPTQISNFKFQISRRLKGEPIAYLTGHKEFYGLDFTVNKNVLIPRPETELMVEEAMKLITHNSQLATHNSQPITFIDVGTGSGCIIITLAKQITNYQLPITNYKFLATDISTKALAVAKQNAQAHNVNKKIKFVKGNLLEPILDSKFVIHNSKFVILANLPYGWRAWKNNCCLDSAGLKYEPKVALFTGKHGLELCEKLLKQTNQLINSRKLASDSLIFVFLEFDPRQTAKIKQLIKQKLPQAKCQIKKGLSGLNRLAIITLD